MVKTTQSVRFAVWLLICLNLLMAYGCIWIFMRIAPVSGESNTRNLRSQAACEEMLTALLHENIGNFELSLKKAGNNVTEAEENAALETISKQKDAAFSGDREARQQVIQALNKLSQINRTAMEDAALKVNRFGAAGSWSVVFMALTMLLLTLIFKRRLMRGVLYPLQEIGNVLESRRNGDLIRRCSGTDLTGDIQRIYNDLNDTLDRKE